MNHILAITLKDLHEVLRDKMTFIFLLAMPILFTLMFGLAFGRAPGQSAPLKVGWIDQDGGEAAQALAYRLEQDARIRLEPYAGSAADLETAVRDGKLAAGVIVPAGYSAGLAAGQPRTIALYAAPANPANLAVQSAARRVAGAAAAARIAVAAGQSYAPAFAQALAAWQEPPLRLSAAVRPAAPVFSFSQTAPAMMIQFALAGIITAAQMMVQERKARCMQRLLTTRAARAEILLGHFLAIFTMIFAQFILLVAFGQAILKLDYLRLPLATLAMMLSAALFTAAVGLLVGSLAQTEDQAVIFALVPMFVLSALGGAWLPLEMTSAGFRTVGQLTPVGLALDGFKNILARALPPQAVIVPALALLAYAGAAFALAVWKFKYE